MRKLVILTYLLTATIILRAQESKDTTTTKEKTKIFETAPQPPGGMSEFHKFISSNLTYPKDAKKLKKQGQVLVEFMVENDGQINPDSVKVIKGVFESFDKEAKRVIGLSPKWTPGTRNGEPIRMRMVIPINFR